MKAICRIAHLDDDILVLKEYSSVLNDIDQEGFLQFSIQSFSNKDDLFLANKNGEFDVFLIDMHLDHSNTPAGLTIIDKIKKSDATALVLALSNDLTLALTALQHGADDFVLKKAAVREVALRISRLLMSKHEPTHIPLESRVIGTPLRDVAKKIPKIINSAVRSVHIYGESGTGKELIAELFENAQQTKLPFLKVNCAGLSPQLMESELFGHSRGAFTGALTDRIGYLEAASGGWIFFDEIHLLPFPAQAALLRALESQEIVRVGEREPRKINIRIISAANVRIDELTTKGQFKHDLWQRISEVILEVPPLRERPGDIEPLLNYFCKTEAGGPYVLLPETLSILKKYDWRRGNVRELRSCIRAMTVAQIERHLTPAAIPHGILAKISSEMDANSLMPKPKAASNFPIDENKSYQQLCEDLFIQLVDSMRQRQPDISLREIGERLGFPKSTLIARLKKLNYSTDGIIRS